MGSAKTSLRVGLSGVTATRAVTEGFFRTFEERLIRMRSLQITLPGRAKGLKLQGSIDGDKLQAAVIVPSVPDERLIPGTTYVALDSEGPGLRFERDKELILHEIDRFHNEAMELHNNGSVPRAWVLATFWGLTRVHYVSNEGTVDSDWAYCETLKRYNEREPIIEVSYHLPGDLAEGVSLTAFIRSHAWSHFSSDFNEQTKQWKPKGTSTPARLNARLLAGVVRAIAQINRAGRICWELDVEGRPDLSGSLREELGRCIGPPDIQIPVAEFPTLDLSREEKGTGVAQVE